MTTIKSLAPADIETGKAYNVARKTNALGQPVTGTRKGDWRAVLVTADNLARYTATTGETYYVQPIKCRHTPRLLAAGWTRRSYSRGDCGAAVTSPGPLHGLACAKPALWATGGSPTMCAQHAAQQLP